VTLEQGDKTMIAAMVGHIFGMKDPWPSAMRIIKIFGNPVWAAWNLILLNHRIVNPGELSVLKTTSNRWAYLQWLKKNPTYTFMGHQDYDSNKTVADYYHMVGLKDKPEWTGMSKLNIARNLRDLADKMERGE